MTPMRLPKGRFIHIHTPKKSKWFLEKSGFHHQICLFSILYKKSHFFDAAMVKLPTKKTN
jgi:hypothetical protein